MIAAPKNANPLHISQFPVEIFHQVFEVVAEFAVSKANEALTLRRFRYQYNLTLTSVCSQWRSIAINHAPLWSMIQLPHSNHAWISEVILRSKEHPLFVSFVPSKHNRLSQKQETTLALVLSHLHRICDFNFSFDSYYLLLDSNRDKLLQMLSHPAPILRNLSIRCLEHTPQSPPLFSSSTPALRHLCLEVCALPRGAPLPFNPPKQLISLRLEYTSADLNLAQFADILRALPNLGQLSITSLSLNCPSGEEPYTLPQGYPRASLDSLKRLFVDQDIYACTGILASISFHPGTDIEIHAGYRDLNDIHLIAPFCRELGKGVNGECVEYVEDLSIVDFTKIECGMVSALDGRYRPGGFKLCLSTGLMIFQTHSQPVERVYCLMANCLASPTVRSFTLCLEDLVESEWRGIFGRMENLETLSLVVPPRRKYEVKGFISALDIPPSARNATTLPHLKSLTFTKYFMIQDFDALCDCLKRRKDVGYSLSTLSFGNAIQFVQERRHYATRYGELGIQ
ncbi:hypothetical protein AX16_002315 [Volvariella volvacea WC 439]|nr:hypothetical protein AX16_002315 [Volvariella volvacea WC 439]